MKSPIQAAVERATWWRQHLRQRCHGEPVGIEPLVKPERRVLIRDCQRAVASYFGVPEASITGKVQSRKIAGYRHIACYLAKKLTAATTGEIGRRTGGRDHSTILNAIRQVEKRRAQSADYEDDIQRLVQHITEMQPC